MNGEKIDCIDSGTKFCPCHLAEAGECILCSQLHDKCFCDCLNWKGVCIYQVWQANGSKPKEGRQTYNCEILESKMHTDDLLYIKFSIPRDLSFDLMNPGSYIFIRTNENFYFDIPISIMDCDTDESTASVLIEIRGIKTKKMKDAKAGDTLTIRGPYWNGVFGIKNVKETINSNCLILARGIGVAPMMPVIKALKKQNNNVKVIIDKAPFNDVYVKDLLESFEVDYSEESLLGAGEITDRCKTIIRDSVEKDNVSLIHCGGADIFTVKVMDFLDEINEDKVKMSCCNNSKMCCGEGVCGSCTARFAGHVVKRLCKIQSDPRNIFQERRFI